MVSLCVKVSVSITKGMSPAEAKQAALSWAQEFAYQRELPTPTVKLEHDGWQAYFKD